MASHLKLGSDGENMAENWLINKGYKIIHRNWRHRHYEIDIIATRNEKLHIVEVKSRNASPCGNPEDSVTRKKFKSLQRATDEFLFLNPVYKWIQYDILAITFVKDESPKFFLLEDVFL